MRPLIIGLGHPLRGDDALGLYCLRALMHLGAGENCDLVTCEADLLRYSHFLRNRSVVVLIDAIASPFPAGSIVRRIGSPDKPWPTWCMDEPDSHGSNLALCLALLKHTTGNLPWLILYGIQPATLGFTSELSHTVLAASRVLIRRITCDFPWSFPEQLHNTTWIRGWPPSRSTEVDDMHGFDWMRAALIQVDEAAKRGNLSTISRVRIAVGEQSGYPVDELMFAFECLKDASLCKNAILDIQQVAAGHTIELIEVEGA